ncbi:hypothetical protein H0H92_013541, partial [Tricholoma furcatifolium]
MVHQSEEDLEYLRSIPQGMIEEFRDKLRHFLDTRDTNTNSFGRDEMTRIKNEPHDSDSTLNATALNATAFNVTGMDPLVKSESDDIVLLSGPRQVIRTRTVIDDTEI